MSEELENTNKDSITTATCIICLKNYVLDTLDTMSILGCSEDCRAQRAHSLSRNSSLDRTSGNSHL